MAEVLNMALDEIISTNKKNNRGGRTRGRGRGGRPTQKKHADQPAHVVKAVSDKLVVSNLAFSVTQNDVKELFSRIGPVKSAQLNYNENGKSKGIANVVFQRAGDAAKAYSEYNNRTLDDRPMKIELIVNPESARLGTGLKLGPRKGGIQKSAGRGRGGRGRGGGRRQPKKPVSAADLDAEMDSYMNDDTMADANELANALA